MDVDHVVPPEPNDDSEIETPRTRRHVASIIAVCGAA